LIGAFLNIIYISQRDVQSKGLDSSLYRNILNIAVLCLLHRLFIRKLWT